MAKVEKVEVEIVEMEKVETVEVATVNVSSFHFHLRNESGKSGSGNSSSTSSPSSFHDPVVQLTTSFRFFFWWLGGRSVPSATPTSVRCSATSARSMDVSWQPPPSSDHNGLIQTYRVHYEPLLTQYGPLTSPTRPQLKSFISFIVVLLFS